MKRLILLFLSLIMLLGESTASEEVYTLPLDLSAGMKLNKAFYHTKHHYQDPTINMDVRENQYGDVKYWIAEIKVQHSSQLRTMPA